jgi:hypothetical protein
VLSKAERSEAAYDNSPSPTVRGFAFHLEPGYIFASARAHEREQSAARTAVLMRLATQGIPIEMLQFHAGGLQFAALSRFTEAVRSHVRAAGMVWKGVPRCAKVHVSGSGVRTSAGMFYTALVALVERGIPVLHFSDSDATMSLIVPETHGAAALAVLRGRFGAPIEPAPRSAIVFDPVRARVRAGERERALGLRQAKLLSFLLANAGRVVSAEEAATHVLGSDRPPRVLTLRVHVHNLRKKIEIDPNNPRHLVTVPNRGYLFLK